MLSFMDEKPAPLQFLWLVNSARGNGGRHKSKT